jgi:hypothetical protein
MDMTQRQITIGSALGNTLQVPLPQVSPAHARLTQLTAETFLLEDLGSKEGTEVNGLRIKRKVVSLADKIKVGNVNITPKLQTLFPKQVPVPLEVKQAFLALKEVHEHYVEAKKTIASKSKWTKIAVRGALGAIPFVGQAISLVVLEFISDEEKLEALDREFRTHYVCPHTGCGVFFGAQTPWERLAEAGSCASCKKSWK